MNESTIDWDFDQDAQTVEHARVPPGTYLCRIDEARPGVTRTGHVRWTLKYVVHDGPHAGRIAVWDGLTFSPKASERTRQVLAALGLPHAGKVRLEPKDLVGRVAFVTVAEGVYRDPETGLTSKRNTVPFAGVRPAEGAAAPHEQGEFDAAAEPSSGSGEALGDAGELPL